MQLSHYIKKYPYEEDPGHLLLFSTKKVSKVRISEETLRSIENGALSASDQDLLSRLGMLVDDREEEKQSVLGLFHRLNTRNPVLNITAVLNLDCNFACVYCYEGDMKGKLYMSDETAEGLMQFIKDHFPEHKKSLIMDFYGGEPLLSIPRIKSISRAMKSFAESRDAEYSFTLVTNGSLFKRRVAEELVPLGLTNVQITLDGPARNHNRFRPFKSGAGSFDTLIRNIQETCDLVKIGLGGNFTKYNYDKFVSLLDDLMEAGLTPDKIAGIKFAPVTNRPEGDTSPTDFRDGCISTTEPWIIRAEALLREAILKRGYNTHKVIPTYCIVEVSDSYVVNFDGMIYKCPGFIGKKGFEVGHVRTGVRDYSSTYKLGMWKNGECTECEYLPLCFGGCRYMTYIRDGNLDQPDCRKAYFDNSLETLVKQDIQYRRTERD